MSLSLSHRVPILFFDFGTTYKYWVYVFASLIHMRKLHNEIFNEQRALTIPGRKKGHFQVHYFMSTVIKVSFFTNGPSMEIQVHRQGFRKRSLRLYSLFALLPPMFYWAAKHATAERFQGKLFPKLNNGSWMRDNAGLKLAQFGRTCPRIRRIFLTFTQGHKGTILMI